MNCEQTLGYPDISFMRRILFLQMQMQGKKRSKVGHLARLFNAADAFSGAKYTHKSKCQDALGFRRPFAAALSIQQYCLPDR